MARYRETPTTVIAATFTAGSAPTSGTAGKTCNAPSGIVRTLITYAGSVTAATLRLYTRPVPGAGNWYRGALTTELSPLVPGSVRESRDWLVGQGTEYLFVVESIAPGTSGNTIAVLAQGVAAS